MNFSKMEKSILPNYNVTKKVDFSSVGIFKHETIKKVFQFSYDMSFGNKGEHRDHRSGGKHQRRKGEIFSNTFQGKLAECAIYNSLYNKLEISEPDFKTYGLGKWDLADFVINNKKISIKSTKSFGNLLLLETKDWNSAGIYIPNKEAYEYIFLVRMKPYCEDILKKIDMLYSDKADKERLNKIISDKKWEYDIPGFITLEELRYIINNQYIIPQNVFLNESVKMDAENYYIQAGDLHPLKEFLSFINND